MADQFDFGGRPANLSQKMSTFLHMADTATTASLEALQCEALHYKNKPVQILNILQPKKENFQIKNSDIFHISAQNIDCGYSLEPPYSIFSKIRKIMFTPVNPSFSM